MEIKIKQYYDTIAQLKNWRRDIDLSDEEDDETFQGKYLFYRLLENYLFYISRHVSTIQ